MIIESRLNPKALDPNNRNEDSLSVNSQDAYPLSNPDRDPEETREWLESLDALAKTHGATRAREIMLSLLKRSHQLKLNISILLENFDCLTRIKTILILFTNSLSY